MLFNSLDFAFFFPIVFIGYWFVFNRSIPLQNAFLLTASGFFYACWDWRFLSLIIFSVLANYVFALTIDRETKPRARKLLLIFILIINAALLCYFKYFDFFIGSFQDAFALLNVKLSFSLLHIVLPLGISFYTFQNISYVTDIYRKHTKAETQLLPYALYISFFPTILSGPVERANHLIPQIIAKREFNYSLAVDGMRMVLLGLFEKVVIGDSCAAIVNTIYSDFETHDGSTLFCTAILYSFQIYGDFSGYSHIAIGCAALLGFRLRSNFNYPYLAKNIADFWRRWHISFSGWLRDYIYFPLGGSKKGDLIRIRNLFIVFIFSGLWHGASFTFIIYGAIHAVLFVIHIYYSKWRGVKKISVVATIVSVFSTFTVLTLARVFFRAPTVGAALKYFDIMLSASLFTKPAVSRLTFVLLFLYMMLERLQMNKKHLLDVSFIRPRYLRYSIYLVMFFCVLYFSGQGQSFVYFKF